MSDNNLIVLPSAEPEAKLPNEKLVALVASVLERVANGEFEHVGMVCVQGKDISTMFGAQDTHGMLMLMAGTDILHARVLEDVRSTCT